MKLLLITLGILAAFAAALTLDLLLFFWLYAHLTIELTAATSIVLLSLALASRIYKRNRK